MCNADKGTSNVREEEMPQCSVTKLPVSVRKTKSRSVRDWITRARVCTRSYSVLCSKRNIAQRTRASLCAERKSEVRKHYYTVNSVAKKKQKKKATKKSKETSGNEVKEEDNFLCGHAFDVLLALGLVPNTNKVEDPSGSRSPDLNRMHVMDGDCEKSSEIIAESAPDIVPSKEVETKVTREENHEESLEVPVIVEETKNVEEEEEEEEGDGEGEEEEAEKDLKAEPVLNGEVNGDVSEQSENKLDLKKDSVVENGGLEDSDEKSVKVDSAESATCEDREETKDPEVKENGSGGCSEEEDRNSVTSSQSRKRASLAEPEGEGSSSESDAGGKRARLDGEGEGEGEDERERLVREYVDDCAESMEDMSRAAEKLQREIGALGELLRTKELEWNSILRLRKLKEEMLERLLRKRRLAVILADNGANNPDWQPNEKNHKSQKNGGGVMMVPIVSSSPSNITPSFSAGPPRCSLGSIRAPDLNRFNRLQRPILPKPSNIPNNLIDQQNSVIGEGRQGPILDVKSIIADYRSRHPESVPRRGRRLRPMLDGSGRGMMDHQTPPPVVSSTRISGSPALMSMANMALGSGSHVRISQDPLMPPFSMAQENSRPSSSDSSRSGHQTEMLPLPAPGLSFKDALVQFAKMSQPPSGLTKPPPPPPPPYPEVTLHPVPAPHSPPPSHSSLLHGILTKSVPPAAHSNPPSHPPPSHRPTTFSPTLARLLTAPERSPATMPSQFRPPANRVSICELLSSSKKSRNEITITPVTSSHSSTPKPKEDVVLLQDDDEETDSTDRLVIDESRDTSASGNEVPADEVPECQGCRHRAAQFVCAGCGNQWYCSRECQVSAWEEHSEMCSG